MLASRSCYRRDRIERKIADRAFRAACSAARAPEFCRPRSVNSRRLPSRARLDHAQPSWNRSSSWRGERGTCN